MAESDSRAPVVEKAQQDPHCPWSFTGVTSPRAVQLTLEGISTVLDT